ncbi:hypothetical protein [Nocardia sp. NPDC057227]|uniref:hypothetical protein n=1 Tax=Nocardia sp. NPDC057227 TaxID=3346056 RepID=UPI00363A864C
MSLRTNLAVVFSLLLGIAFVVAPEWLAASDAARFADEGALRQALSGAYAEYRLAGQRAFTPALRDIVGYWARYHLVKAVIAVTLLLVLAVLVRWAGNTAAKVPASVLALGALALAAANIQGAAAPFAAVLPMLPGAELAAAERQLGAGERAPALAVMIDDFARFHAVLAVLAAVVALCFLGAGLALFARRALLLGGIGIVLALGIGTVAVANATTARDPEPAFAAFLEGSW